MQKDKRIYCEQGPDLLAPITEGKLSGLSFVFKDLFDVKGYKTGAGNPRWLASHSKAERTSPLIKKLLSAGGMCVGRVQTDELAYSLNGQNKHYGTPINPIANDCIPGGSSSGSAVAVAMEDCDFSIGTDTGGSVRVPASYCGLYGLRPTLGSLSLDHCFELSKSFDTAGIFTRDLTVMQQVWETLSKTEPSSLSKAVVYLDSLLYQQMSEERHTALNAMLSNADIEVIEGHHLQDNGWTLTGLSELFRTIQGYEIIQRHGQWLDNNIDSLDESIALRVDWAKTITESDYTQALQQQDAFKQQLQQQMAKHDGYWMIPTTPSGPPKLDSEEAYLAQYRSVLIGLTSIAGLSGLPQLHIPIASLSEGPCGFSLMGQAHKEHQVIQTAQKFVA
ncbi:amidase [Vibrio astriarenae]